MKKTLALAAMLLSVAASSALALVGGPWDSNIYGNPNKVDPTNYDGTYQGTIKGKNLSGLMVFGSSTAGTSGSAGYSETVTSGTGNNQRTTTYNYASTVQGYSVIYIEGKVAYSDIVISLDLGGRKISGIMQGAGSSGITQTLTNSLSNKSWYVTDAITFAGTFTAKLSKNWAANSFSGKGSLQVSKVDVDGFNLAQTTDANAVPQIVTQSTAIKVAGVKTSNTANSYYVSIPNTVPEVISTTGTTIINIGTTVLTGTTYISY